jgi:hypothetical protein
MEWQPIETAPKDGEFLVYSSDDGVVAVYPSRSSGMFLPKGGGRDSDDVSRPTHWMPLPPPPPLDQKYQQATFCAPVPIT